MDDEYQRAQQENLSNPKNRYFGLFCHAREIDNSWGCGWSFATGVIIFSIIMGIACFVDIYFIAAEKIFNSYAVNKGFKFMMVLKILSDLVSLIGIIIACIAVNKENLTYSIVCYYVVVLSFLLNTIFVVYTIVAIFYFFDVIKYFFGPWLALEFILFWFCWILFANQVYLGRKRRGQLNQTGN